MKKPWFLALAFFGASELHALTTLGPCWCPIFVNLNNELYTPPAAAFIFSVPGPAGSDPSCPVGFDYYTAAFDGGAPSEPCYPQSLGDQARSQEGNLNEPD